MSWLVTLWLVYCTSLLWIIPAVAQETNQGECSHMLSEESGQISAYSLNFTDWGYDRCVYYISAPQNYYIQFNFTSMFGFTAYHNSKRLCKARLSVVDGMVVKNPTDNTGNNVTLFEDSGASIPPHRVFQSQSNSVRIVYVVNKCGQTQSGFSLSFNFLRKNNQCAFYCDSAATCLPASRLCDRVNDCWDKSDEQLETCSHNTRTSHLAYIVIVGIVVLLVLLGSIVCIAKHNGCLGMSHVRQRTTLAREAQRPQSQTSEVIDSSPSHEQNESLLPINCRSPSGYPPHVPRSKDGEEGYRESQKDILNIRQNSTADIECFRSPPNRTVYDVTVPSPFTCETQNRSPSSSISSKDYKGCPVIRCYSMSSNTTNGGTRPSLATTPRTYHSSSVGHPGGILGPPPGYSESYHSTSMPQRVGHRQCFPDTRPECRAGQVSRATRGSPPEYHNSFSVTSANMYCFAASPNNSNV